MFEVGYYPSTQELLIDGDRQDYEQLVLRVRDLFAMEDKSKVLELAVTSTGEAPVTHIVVRKGNPPNCVSYESEKAVFAIAPALLKQFLSFLDFSGIDEMQNRPVHPHYHFDYIGQDDYITPDSIPVVFALK